MNRYFYVPVIDNCISHDGISLSEHLKIVDLELFERENKFFGPFDGSFFNGIQEVKKMNSDYHNKKTDQLFKSRSIPRFIVIVFNEDGLYELASEERIDSISLDYLKQYEVFGMDVIDVFTENPDYTFSAKNFFDSYNKEKNQKDSDEVQPKKLTKLPFFKR